MGFPTLIPSDLGPLSVRGPNRDIDKLTEFSCLPSKHLPTTEPELFRPTGLIHLRHRLLVPHSVMATKELSAGLIDLWGEPLKYDDDGVRLIQIAQRPYRGFEWLASGLDCCNGVVSADRVRLRCLLTDCS